MKDNLLATGADLGQFFSMGRTGVAERHAPRWSFQFRWEMEASMRLVSGTSLSVQQVAQGNFSIGKAKPIRRRTVLCAGAIAALAAQPLYAASGTWSGAVDGAWENAGNWSSLPGSSAGVSGTSTDIGTFSGMPVTNNVVTVDANRNVFGLLFDPDPTLSHPDPQTGIPFIKIGAAPNTGNTLYLSDGGITQTSTVDITPGDDPVESDINAPMVLNGTSYTFANFAGSPTNTLGALRLFGNITPSQAGLTTLTLDGDHGSGGSCRAEIMSAITDGAGQLSIVKNGIGAWEVNADSSNPNTYSGDTIINAGILRSSSGSGTNGLGGFSANSHYIVNNGGTLRNSVTGTTIKKVTVNFGGAITASSAGSTRLNIDSESGAAINLIFDAPTNSNPISLAIPFSLVGETADEGGVTLLAAPGAAGTGPVTFGNSSSPFDMGTVRRIFNIGKGSDANTDYDLRIQGPITGSGGFVKRGAGILRFSGAAAANLTGTIEIQEGTFNPSAANLFAGTLPPLLISGGNLRVQSDQLQTFGAVNVSAGGISSGNDKSAVAAPSFVFAVASAGDTITSSAGLIDNGGGTTTLTKDGPGRLVLGGDLNRLPGGLTVNAGLVLLAADNTAPATRVTHAGPVTVGAGAKIDLRDNKLITSSPAGTWAGTSYTGIAGLVDSGRGDAGNAQWNGATGIVTTDSRAINNGDLVSIGVAKVSEVRTVADTETTTFAAQTVLGSDTIVMATWGGDANLDGKINIDDYGRIDGNVGQSGSVFGWSKGDFNYDGKINIDDYGIIDGNINRQGVAFETAGGVALDGVAAVPEPAGISLLALGALPLIRRRRK